jgi:hypothetical protein
MELKESKESDVKYHIFNCETSNSLSTLLELYEKDPYKASVFFKMNKSNTFMKFKTVVFEYPNKDFRFCVIQKKYGISKTNRIYSREKTTTAISYKHKNKTMYLLSNKTIRPLNYGNLSCSLTSDDLKNFIQYASEKFTWIRNIVEDKKVHFFPFNNVMRYKLYNAKDMLKHSFKLPYPTIKNFLYNDDKSKNFDYYYLKGLVKLINGHVTNIENLTPEFVTDEYFHDTINMAHILGYKVNCSWSKRRLKEVHDDWTKEILKFQLEFEPIRNLKISDIYLKFAEFTNYELLKTNHDLISEGKFMKHCVGTYSNRVDNGDCAIFRVAGHTLEVSHSYYHNKLSLVQLRGFNNIAAPDELQNAVKQAVDDFNDKFKYELISESSKNKNNHEEDDFYIDLF